MDEDPRKWLNQFYANFGGKEFLRLGCAIGIWFSLGIGLSDIFNSRWILFAFIALLFIYSLLALLWRPTYIIHRKILGNPHLPTEPMPHRRMKAPQQTQQPIPWPYYVPAILVSIMKMLVALLVSYFIIKYVFK